MAEKVLPTKRKKYGTKDNCTMAAFTINKIYENRTNMKKKVDSC